MGKFSADAPDDLQQPLLSLADREGGGNAAGAGALAPDDAVIDVREQSSVISQLRGFLDEADQELSSIKVKIAEATELSISIEVKIAEATELPISMTLNHASDFSADDTPETILRRIVNARGPAEETRCVQAITSWEAPTVADIITCLCERPDLHWQRLGVTIYKAWIKNIVHIANKEEIIIEGAGAATPLQRAQDSYEALTVLQENLASEWTRLGEQDILRASDAAYRYYQNKDAQEWMPEKIAIFEYLVMLAETINHPLLLRLAKLLNLQEEPGWREEAKIFLAAPKRFTELVLNCLPLSRETKGVLLAETIEKKLDDTLVQITLDGAQGNALDATTYLKEAIETLHQALSKCRSVAQKQIGTQLEKKAEELPERVDYQGLVRVMNLSEADRLSDYPLTKTEESLSVAETVLEFLERPEKDPGEAIRKKGLAIFAAILTPKEWPEGARFDKAVLPIVKQRLQMIRALLKWTLDRTRSREEEFVKISLERYQFARQRREMKDATIRSLFEETQLIQAGEIDVNKARDTLAQLQNAYEQLAEAQKLRQGQTSRYHEAHQWLANERVRYFKRHNGEQDPIYHFSQLFEIHSMLDLFPFGARRLTDKNIIEKIAELDCALVAMLAHEIVAVMIHEKTANKNLIERQQVKLVSDIQRETRTNGSALRMLIDHIHYGRRERAELEKIVALALIDTVGKRAQEIISRLSPSQCPLEIKTAASDAIQTEIIQPARVAYLNPAAWFKRYSIELRWLGGSTASFAVVFGLNLFNKEGEWDPFADAEQNAGNSDVGSAFSLGFFGLGAGTLVSCAARLFRRHHHQKILEEYRQGLATQPGEMVTGITEVNPTF